MKAEEVSGSAPGNILVREMRLTDIIPLYRLHMALGCEERRLYHPFPYVPWKVLLFLCVFYSTSRMAVARYIVPRASFHVLVAVDRGKREHAGFAYLQIPRRQSRGQRVAMLGIMVARVYRGAGVAKSLIRGLISLAGCLGRDEIRLAVMQDNAAAISLYEGLDFKIIKEDGYEVWQGEKIPYYDMKLAIKDRL